MDNLTAEEFFRTKIKGLTNSDKEFSLSSTTITAEQGMRWAHEYATLHSDKIIKTELPSDWHTTDDYSEVESKDEGGEKWRAHFVYTYGKDRTLATEYIDIPMDIIERQRIDIESDILIGFCDNYLLQKYGHESQQYSIYTFLSNS